MILQPTAICWILRPLARRFSASRRRSTRLLSALDDNAPRMRCRNEAEHRLDFDIDSLRNAGTWSRERRVNQPRHQVRCAVILLRAKIVAVSVSNREHRVLNDAGWAGSAI